MLSGEFFFRIFMFHTNAHNIFMENKQTKMLLKINENYI